MHANKFKLSLFNAPRIYDFLIIIWSLLVVGSLAWDLQQISQNTYEIATAAARAIISKDLAFRRWVGSHGGVYVPPSESTPPNPYLKVPDRDVVTNTGKALTLMNPAYALRELQSDFGDEYGKSRITSLKVLNPKNAPDAWETETLQTFEQGSTERKELQYIDQQPYLRIMLPLKTDSSCLKCHAFQGYKIGDIRGGLSTRVPMRSYLIHEHETSDRLAFSHGAIWLIGLIGLCIASRRSHQLTIERRQARDWLKNQNILLEAELERRQQENQHVQLQLLQSEKLAAIGQLAAGIAHEINNPIGFVNSNLNSLNLHIADIFEILNSYDSLLKKETISQDTLKIISELKRQKELDYLASDIPQLIAESSEGLGRVRNIIQDLKSFSRVDSDDWELVNLHKCLDSTLNIISSELKYHCTVHKIYGEIPEIYCLASQLNQVFMNLLINAAQAIKDQGDITIRTLKSATEVWVEISDTGQGIAPELINRLFEPFFTTKPIGKGTGLGLSISQNIIQKHDGRIEVVSTVNIGTTFRICLPIQHKQKIID